jgi:NAD(P)-dependent dehydrogenase (short-subunit alcohol dehydrogenase family)
MKNLFSVQETVVLISGSSRGIGLELARGFLDQGAKVSILSENAEELSRAFEELKRTFSDRVYEIVCDVRSFDACQEAIQKTVAQFGTLTSVICNAGVDRIKPVESYSESDWKFILEINLQGAFSIAQAAVQYFLKSHIAGSVTFTSSIAGSIGISGLVPYAASKGGINQMTKTMAVELGSVFKRTNKVKE